MAVLKVRPDRPAGKKIMETKNDKKVDLIANELRIARILAGNDKKARDKALHSLKKWLSQPMSFRKIDFEVIWKGLFYCMWMSDKPLTQEECADTIAKLVHYTTLDNALLFFKTGLTLLINEWFGIDQLRLDKFLMLVRRLLREMLMVLQNSFTKNNIVGFNDALSQTVLSNDQQPVGLFMHFTEIFMEELAKVMGGKINPDRVVDIIKPFVKKLTTSDDSRQIDHIRRFIFNYLMRQSDVGLQYQQKYEAWKQLGFPGSIDSMQKIKIDNDEKISPDEKLSGNDIKEKPLDPRAGRVDVELPQIKFRAKGVAAALLESKYDKNSNIKSRKILTLLAEQFNKLAQGIYPLGVNRIRRKEKDNVINIRKSANRLIKFDQKLLGKNKKRKSDNTDETKQKRRKTEDKFDDDLKQNNNNKEVHVQQAVLGEKNEKETKKRRRKTVDDDLKENNNNKDVNVQQTVLAEKNEKETKKKRRKTVDDDLKENNNNKEVHVQQAVLAEKNENETKKKRRKTVDDLKEHNNNEEVHVQQVVLAKKIEKEKKTVQINDNKIIKGKMKKTKGPLSVVENSTINRNKKKVKKVQKKLKKRQAVFDNIECVFERNSGIWVVFDVSNEHCKHEVLSHHSESVADVSNEHSKQEVPSHHSESLADVGNEHSKHEVPSHPSESVADCLNSPEKVTKSFIKSPDISCTALTGTDESETTSNENLIKLKKKSSTHKNSLNKLKLSPTKLSGDIPNKTDSSEENGSLKLGLNPVKLFESPQEKELFPKSSWDEPLQEGEYEICIPSKKHVGKLKKLAKKKNQIIHELVNTTLEKLMGKSRLSLEPRLVQNPFSSPSSSKKVKINTRLNRSQEVHEHHAQIRNSPSIPYDANKMPLKPLLKTPVTSTPVNPFYKKRLSMW